jgi:hypothetical protein
MHAGVRTPGADESYALRCDAAEGGLGDLLHATGVLLGLPTCIGRSVILHTDSDSQ